MSQNPPPNQPPRGKPPEAWRVERMVQRVPGHLGEESRFSPWLVVAAVALVVVVGALLLFMFQSPGAGSASVSTTATPRSRTTVIRITATPLPTVTGTVTPPPTPAFVIYTVKSGDTLSKIAQKFKVSVEAIRAANNLQDDTIHLGENLKIPQGTPTPPAMTSTGGPATGGNVFRTPTLIAFALSPTPATPTTPTPTPGVVSYTVKTGDSLISIAAVFSTTVQSIMDLNKLDSPNNIKAGQALTVPVGIWTPTAVPTVYLSPTPTVTPQYSYGAPDLLFPSDGADLAHGASITLQWLSPGTLDSDEYYVVHLSYLADGVEQDLAGYAVYEGTSLTLEDSPVAVSPTEFSWYVLVVRGSGCSRASSAAVQPCAVSPLSEKRTFVWR